MKQLKKPRYASSKHFILKEFVREAWDCVEDREDTLTDQISWTANVTWGEAQLQPSAAAASLIPAVLTPQLLLNLKAGAVCLGRNIFPPAFKQHTTLLDPNSFVR